MVQPATFLSRLKTLDITKLRINSISSYQVLRVFSLAKSFDGVVDNFFSKEIAFTDADEGEHTSFYTAITT